MRVVKYGNDLTTKLPVTGGGSAMVAGALLKPGPTPGTNNGILILGSANTTASPDAIGILRQAHATADDTTLTGTLFTTKPVQLIVPGRILRLQYDPATVITVTQAVSTTTITLTNLEDDIDGSFLYVSAGTGAGQTNYLTASAAGSATLKAAFTTSLDTTSRLIKILNRFHPLVGLSSDGTKLGSYDVVGVHTVMIIDTFIVRNGDEVQMDPTKHAALTGLNALRSISFEADVMWRNTTPYSID